MMRFVLSVLVFPAAYLFGAFIAWDFNWMPNVDHFERAIALFVPTYIAAVIALKP